MNRPLALIVGSINEIAPVQYLIASFQELGWDTFVISDKKSELAQMSKYGAVDVHRVISKNNLSPKFLLFVEGGEMLVFPTNFSELEFPTIWWGIDTHNDYQKHLRISLLFDYSLIAQKSYLLRLQGDGITGLSWFPLASPIESPRHGERSIDVGYIGSTNWNLYPERKKLLQVITETVDNHVIGTRSADEMLQIYSSSKIVFNQSLKNDINMRIFETMGAGALLITNPIHENGMEELFSEGTDYVTYVDVKDLKNKIQHFLLNESERNAIALSGMTKVHALHTYSARASEIVGLSTSGLAKTGYTRMEESAALISMGMYADAIESFRIGLRTEARGARSKFVSNIAGPILWATSKVAKAMEMALQARRLFS